MRTTDNEDIELLVIDFCDTLVYFPTCDNLGFKPRQGVMDFLEYYRKKGVPIAISSDEQRAGIDNVITGLGIRGYIAAIYGTEHLIPNDELVMLKDISRICIDFSTPPERTLVIGDNPGIDGESAKKAGANYIHVPIYFLDKEFTFDRLLRQDNAA